MDTFNIHEAKTQLSKLVERAAKGEAFVIAKAGKPMVKVTAYVDVEPAQRPRLGTLEGLIDIPDGFDELGRDDIERAFYGEPEG